MLPYMWAVGMNVNYLRERELLVNVRLLNKLLFILCYKTYTASVRRKTHTDETKQMSLGIGCSMIICNLNAVIHVTWRNDATAFIIWRNR